MFKMLPLILVPLLPVSSLFAQGVPAVPSGPTDSAPAAPELKLYAELYGGLTLGGTEQRYAARGTNNETGVTIDVPAGQNDADFFGYGIGGKLGGNYKGLIGGGDARFTLTTHDYYSYDGTTSDAEYTAGNLTAGLFLGYRFDFGLGFWTGYNPIDALSLTKKKDELNYGGDSYKFGLGLEFTKWSINLEYIKHRYDERDSNQLPYRYELRGVDIVEEEMNVDEIFLYISLPFGLN